MSSYNEKDWFSNNPPPGHLRITEYTLGGTIFKVRGQSKNYDSSEVGRPRKKQKIFKNR